VFVCVDIGLDSVAFTGDNACVGKEFVGELSKYTAVLHVEK
jgi:hypothetical protein